MSTEFQPGQKVRYIEETATLTNGGVYTVSKRHYSGKGVNLEELPNGEWWYDRRFELVDQVKTVPVRTKEQVQADRKKELLDGVVAYHTAGQEVPRDWIEELFYNVRN